MAGFKFNLETVLKLKIQMENSVKNEMAKAVAFLEKQNGLLINLEDKLNETILERNAATSLSFIISTLFFAWLTMIFCSSILVFRLSR